MEIPKIGDHGCYSIGSDAYPVTCVKVSKSGKAIWAQFDKFSGDVENGHEYFGIQKWKFERDENGRIERFDWAPSRNKYAQQGVGRVSFGGWYAKQDPGF